MDEHIRRLAEAAHEVWMARRRSQGWRYGERYDEKAKTHDAMVPFEQLPAVDRRDGFLAAKSLIEAVLSEYEIGRGPDREFTALDIRIGQQVVIDLGVDMPEATVDAIGRIVGWTESPFPPILQSITVEWRGEEYEYDPIMRDLRRADEVGIDTTKDE